ncbi:hypothetical protein M885DRAFT_335824 [Pelagophyceae sp. CCMP2097]|nr:hypothetical protein M885DRAFT_335824 [Pelagophyceae sp. CCMP2097]
MAEGVRVSLARAKALAPASQRAFSLVLGAVVGDAAAVRCHWQYDAQKLRAALKGKEAAFSTEAHNPFYRVADGRNSCYGDQLRCVLASLAKTHGSIDAGDAAKVLRERMTAPDYEATAEVRRTRAAYADDQKARAGPVAGPWRHGTIERFLAGEVDDADASADAVLRALPVAAFLAALRPEVGDAELLRDVDTAVTLTQRNAAARSHAAAVSIAAARLVSGAATTPRDAIDQASKCAPVASDARETFEQCLGAADALDFDGAVGNIKEFMGSKKLIA